MRYVVGLVLVVAALPLRASAQPDWDWCHDPLCPELSKTEVAPERSVLKLDESSLGIAPSAPTLEEMERRTRQARTGLIVSSIVGLGTGAALLAGSQLYVGNADFNFGPNIAMGTFGLLLSVVGIVGIGVYGHRLRTAKQELRLEEQNKPQAHRVQWDLARSRLVF